MKQSGSRASLVTILLPVRNGAPFLGAAMDSILAQTLTNLTLVVVDDGSTDESVKVAEAHADERTEIISDGRQIGLVGRLNRSLDRARTRYVARMDADDVAEPRRLALQLAQFEGDPRLGICGGQYEAFAGEAAWHSALPTTHYAIAARTLFDSPFGHPTVVFDMGHLDRAGLRYDEEAKYAEDYDLWERAQSLVRMANVDEVVLRYRVHPGQLSRQNSAEQRAASDRVRRRALERLGLGFTGEEFDLHCALSNNTLPGTAAAYDAAREWLHKIRRTRSIWSPMDRAIRAECRRREALLRKSQQEVG